jgi:hypothetical protein
MIEHQHQALGQFIAQPAWGFPALEQACKKI